MLDRFRRWMIRQNPGIELGYYEADLRIAARKFGRNSRKALIARGNYAAMLDKCGETRKALDELASIVRVMRDEGLDSADSLLYKSETVHAKIQFDGGFFEEAEREFSSLAQECIGLLGADNPCSIQACEDHAAALFMLNRVPEAEAEIAEVVEKRTGIAGFDDPETVHARTEHAKYLGALGRHGDAEATWRALAVSKSRLLGPNHVETLEAREGCANSLYKLRRFQDAIVQYRDVAKSYELTLGADDPDARRVRKVYDHLIQEMGGIDDDSSA